MMTRKCSFLADFAGEVCVRAMSAACSPNPPNAGADRTFISFFTEMHVPLRISAIAKLLCGCVSHVVH